jgi:hypothetical protein
MGRPSDPMACGGCRHGRSRRDFLHGFGAAAAAGLMGPLGCTSGGGTVEGTKGEKARVALVFIANSEDREIWPYPGYDCASRQREIQALLRDACPGVEFVPVVLKKSADVSNAVALQDAVDGYLIYALTLNWWASKTMSSIGRLGKPTLVADEFLGGCGAFLTGVSGLRRQGLEVAAVSTTRLGDLAAVARCFGDAKKPGATPAAFARQCEEVYRRTFAAAGGAKGLDDAVPLAGIGECVKRLKESRFLIVGAGQQGKEQEFLGAKGIYIGFEQLQAFYDKADRDEAADWGRRWSARTEKVVEPTADWIQKAGAVYLAMRALMKKHEADAITMNCLGGFNAGKLPAYPCLGFMQLLDDGSHGVCEAQPDDSVSMLMARFLTGRAGYVSDPALDTSKNQIVYAHCMAHTKAFGTTGQTSRFRIRTLHNLDPRGCCAQSFLPEGYMTTTFRTSVSRKQMVIHQAKSVGNLDAARGCRTQLVGEVRGDIGKLFSQWDLFGWHRVTVYGDVREPLIELGKALGLEVVQEA